MPAQRQRIPFEANSTRMFISIWAVSMTSLHESHDGNQRVWFVANLGGEPLITIFLNLYSCMAID